MLSVSIHHVVDGSRVVLFLHLKVNNVLPDEDFLCNLYNLVFSVLIENNDIVHIRTVANKLIFLQSRTNKALLAIDIQLLVRLYNTHGINILKVADFCQTRIFPTVFLLEILEPVARHRDKVF